MKIKEIILGLIIAVVFLMFAVYGTKLIYDSPDYGEYCEKYPPAPQEKNLTNRTFGNQLNERDCYINYEKARKDYSKNMFIISIIISTLAILISSFIIKVETISGGLMLGSLMFLIYGTGGYWRYMDDLLRFGILGLALGVLIYIGYKLNRMENGKS
jgi:hypothetical protein